MSDGTLSFTGKERALETVSSFKQHVLATLGIKEVFSMKAKEDWLDLLHETRVALHVSDSVTLYIVDQGIFDTSDYADTIDVARGKMKPSKTTLSRPDDVEDAIVEHETLMRFVRERAKTYAGPQ